MNPVINLEEQIGKTVGRRVPADPLKIQPGEIEDARAWSRAFPGVSRSRPGVYKFHSHEEADAWLMNRRTKNPI